MSNSAIRTTTTITIWFPFYFSKFHGHPKLDQILTDLYRKKLPRKVGLRLLKVSITVELSLSLSLSLSSIELGFSRFYSS